LRAATTRILLAATAVALAIVAAASARSAALPLPTLYGSEAGNHYGWFVRPAEIGYTGDGSGNLGGLHRSHSLPWGALTWTSWTRTQALGGGTVWLDDCNPDCASGTFHPYSVSLRAFRVIGGHFTRLTLTYAYDGKHVVDKRGIEKYPGGGWEYFIVGYP